MFTPQGREGAGDERVSRSREEDFALRRRRLEDFLAEEQERLQNFLFEERPFFAKSGRAGGREEEGGGEGVEGEVVSPSEKGRLKR